jgi:hypothetical protein
MDYQEGIDLPFKNLGTACWVTEIISDLTNPNNIVTVVGHKFDGWRGFETQYDSSYIGKVIFISKSHKSIHDVEIHAKHVRNKGWLWSMKSDALIPDTPFLISNRIKLDITFEGQVNLLPEDAMGKLKEINGNNFTSPVIINAENFGLITIKNESVNLIVFSEPQKKQVIESLPLQFPGNNFVIGYITLQ